MEHLRDCFHGTHAAGAVTQKHSFKVLATVGGLFDGVPLEVRTLTIKAARLRGLFRIQAHGYHSLRALLINSAREARSCFPSFLRGLT